MNEERYHYDGNSNGNYDVFDSKRSERKENTKIAELYMGEDCVIHLVQLLNENNFESKQ